MTEEQMNFAYEQAVRAAVDVATRITDSTVFAGTQTGRTAADVAEEVVKAARRAAEVLNGSSVRSVEARA